MQAPATRSLAVVALAAATSACGFGLEPPASCDLEVTVDDREFDVDCDYEADEGEYDCECTGTRVPLSQEPPSCAEQCAGSPDKFCLEDCDDSRAGDTDGPVFSEDFQDDTFCSLSDDEQKQAAIDACDLE